MAISTPRLNGAGASPDDLTALAWSVHEALAGICPRSARITLDERRCMTISM